MSSWTGNKGEWSEPYVFLSLLCNPKLGSADANLENKIGQTSIVKEICIPDAGAERKFVPGLEYYENPQNHYRIYTSEIEDQLQELYREISSVHEESTFQVPKIQLIYEKLGLMHFKMSSKSKLDIKLTLETRSGLQEPALGFSIKSQTGSPSTLMNSSKATNIIFEVSTVEQSELLRRANLEHYRDIMDYCSANDISMTYKGYSSDTFHSNLAFFGADFPEFYANLVRMYVARDAKTRVLSELVTISSGNSQDSKIRQYQMKSFLRAVALGLVPGSIWNGKLSTYGGYIVVKESGEILALHLSNDDDFRDYLFENTVLTTPKSKLFLRTDYVEGLAQIAFNVQLRFIK